MITADPLAINRAYYESHAEEFCRRTADLALDDLYQPFLRLLPSGGHILDAGCGTGRDGAAFRAKGFRVTAIDASRAMVHAATARGLPARVLPFQKMKFTAEFDGIWACASLLHVPHREMPDVLARFARALKSGGILYVSLKEGDGERVAKDGRFFSYFHREEFEALLTEEGRFALIDFWLTHAGDSSGTEWPWLNFLAARPS